MDELIFDILKPGTGLTVAAVKGALDPAAKMERGAILRNLIASLVDNFHDANLALNMYRRSVAEVERRAERARTAGEKTRWTLLDPLPKIILGPRHEAELPLSLLRRTPPMHARTFVFSLDNFSKLLEALCREAGEPAELKSCHAAFEAKFPDLAGVRDSAHHPEKHVRWKVHGRSLPTNVLVTNGLRGDELVFTMANGQQGCVPVTEESMTTVQVVLQTVMTAFQWQGFASPLPE